MVKLLAASAIDSNGTTSSPSPCASKIGIFTFNSSSKLSGSNNRPEKPTTPAKGSALLGAKCKLNIVPWLNPSKIVFCSLIPSIFIISSIKIFTVSIDCSMIKRESTSLEPSIQGIGNHSKPEGFI